MSRDPLASAKARKAERKADEKSGLITIKPLKLEAPTSTTASLSAAAPVTGFKKGGFKSAFGEVKSNTGTDDEGVKRLKIVGVDGGEGVGAVERAQGGSSLDVESDTEDEGYEVYDPRRPTGCFDGCPVGYFFGKKELEFWDGYLGGVLATKH